tara:strand:+ start:390 stop:704 length:315 start_codon:yes stop_codon:yes gene_type:complete
MKYSPLIYGLISGIIFSMVDSGLFLITEKKTYHYLEERYPELDEYEIPIIIGGAAAAVSLFIANYIEKYLHNYFTIHKFPSLDAIGIIVGVFIVIGIYERLFKI